jgi:phosphopantetheinyl transferase (holo-ACP synthase)
MSPKSTDLTILNLATFRENLKKMMKPEILSHFMRFLECTENNNGSMLERFKLLTETSEYAADCKYAQMAKEFFLKDQAEACAKALCWLYKNWARIYEE